MMMPSATAITTVPFTVPRTASAILPARRSPGIAQQAVGGFEPARGEPAAVAEHEEQRDQREEEQEHPAQQFAAERARSTPSGSPC